MKIIQIERETGGLSFWVSNSIEDVKSSMIEDGWEEEDVNKCVFTEREIKKLPYELGSYDPGEPGDYLDISF